MTVGMKIHCQSAPGAQAVVRNCSCSASNSTEAIWCRPSSSASSEISSHEALRSMAAAVRLPSGKSLRASWMNVSVPVAASARLQTAPRQICENLQPRPARKSPPNQRHGQLLPLSGCSQADRPEMTGVDVRYSSSSPMKLLNKGWQEQVNWQVYYARSENHNVQA